MGPGVANECVEAKDGPTIWEDHFYPEVIDPESGEVLPDGEEGELVFTSLTKEAMPVIRYRTRDLTRLQPGTARPAHRRMARIKARSDDMLIIRGVNVFPSQIEEQILACAELAPHYLLEITRAEPQACAQLRQRLAHGVKQMVGVSIDVRIAAPGEIERSQGKAKRIVDRRDLW
jgi:phenylacetate-CoA ligase